MLRHLKERMENVESEIKKLNDTITANTIYIRKLEERIKVLEKEVGIK